MRCLLFLLLPSVALAQDIRPTIDSMVDRQVTADAFSGVVAVARRGAPLYQRAAGTADRSTNQAMTVDTRIQIASVTKLFTNIAIRQLEQAGKLALTDTVGRFLPDYPNPVVRSRVTIEQLLTHRSGIGSFWNARWMATRAEVRTVQDYLRLFEKDSLLFSPGTAEAYSNGGYVVLGAIIEKVSGQPYHDYLREHVFTPAGMTRTVPYERGVRAPIAAVGYTRQPPLLAGNGDQRLAGSGPRPGYEPASGAPPGEATPERRMRIVGADGKQLSQEEAQAAMARRMNEGGQRNPNVDMQPGRSGPAGDHYSTVGDFLRLADALRSHRLLDSSHTAALLGQSYARGLDFRSSGGGPGANAEFSMYANGDVMVVLSNYDPPAATTIAQGIRSALRAPPAVRISLSTDSVAVRMVDSLWAAMYARQDTALALQVYSRDLVFRSSDGRTKTLTQELADVRPQPGLVMDYFRTSPASIKVLGDSASVTGLAQWQFKFNGSTRQLQRGYTLSLARGGALGWTVMGVTMSPPSR